MTIPVHFHLLLRILKTTVTVIQFDVSKEVGSLLTYTVIDIIIASTIIAAVIFVTVLASKDLKFRKNLESFVVTVFAGLFCVSVYFHGETMLESFQNKYVFIGIIFILICSWFINDHYKDSFIAKFLGIRSLTSIILLFVAASSGSFGCLMLVRMNYVVGTYLSSALKDEEFNKPRFLFFVLTFCMGVLTYCYGFSYVHLLGLAGIDLRFFSANTCVVSSFLRQTGGVYPIGTQDNRLPPINQVLALPAIQGDRLPPILIGTNPITFNHDNLSQVSGQINTFSQTRGVYPHGISRTFNHENLSKVFAHINTFNNNN